MGFLQFIFSSFWVWIGFFILAAGVASSIIEMAKILKSGRRVSIYKTGRNWHIAIDNATDVDVIAALREKERITQEDKTNET